MFEILRNVIAFIVAIGVLVAFHEYGHFWAARRLGVRVLRFSIGFGRPLWQRRGKDGVEYVLAAIPLGGYVKLLDERETPVPEDQLAQAFNRKPIAARIAIFAAGPAFNFVLASLMFWATLVIGVPGMKPFLGEPPAATPAATVGIHDGDRVEQVNGKPVQSWGGLRTDVLRQALDSGSLGLDLVDAAGQSRHITMKTDAARIDPQYLMDDLGLVPYQPPIPATLGEIMRDSAAERAGLRSGDRVLAFDGEPVPSFQKLQHQIASHPNAQVTLKVQRGEQTLDVPVHIGSVIENESVRGRLGATSMRVANADKIWQDLRTEERLGPLAAIPEALKQTQRETVLVVKLLGRMALGDISVKNLSGPISTAEAAGFAASVGLSTFLYFIAFVSLNVGIVNLLPIPILDGGQIVSCLVEGIKGAPLSDRTQVLVQQIGFALLMLIMGFAFYNDITRSIG
jgi:regulator of sigma E protease